MRLNIKLLIVLVLLAAASVLAQSKEVDDYLQKRLKAQPQAGISVAVVQDGKTVYAKGVGMANLENNVPATENTAYQLASVTKQFTATAVMMLVEEDKVGLDEPIGKYLANLPAAWQALTVRQLLTHTSGVPNYTRFFGSAEKTKDYTHEDILKLVADKPMDFPAGEKWSYSNTGYYLLGMMIEKVSGKDYPTFMRERIFAPLGMSATRFNDLRDLIKDRATGYTFDKGEVKHAVRISPTQPFAAGGLISTVMDMVKWDAAQNTEKLLKQASLKEMLTPAKLKDGSPTTYGFGWGVKTYRTVPMIAHNGGIDGFSTNIARFPDQKVTVIVLANSDAANAEKMSEEIAAFYIPALVANAPKPIEDKDTKTTAFLRKVADAIVAGNAEADWFTPETQKTLFPDRIKQVVGLFAGKGGIKTFELMEEGPREQNKYRGYLAAIGDLKVRFNFVLAPDGKIAAVGLRPE